MHQIYEGLVHCREFVAALRVHDLIEAANFDITLSDGSQNQLLGFHVLNEEKVRQLPGEVLEEFSKKSYLMPLFMILASMGNMRTLIQRKDRKELG